MKGHAILLNMLEDKPSNCSMSSTVTTDFPSYASLWHWWL